MKQSKPKLGYKFVLTRSNGNKVIYHIDGEHQGLDELLTAFQDFLRGCGFYFDGQLDVTYEEESEKQEQESDENFLKF